MFYRSLVLEQISRNEMFFPTYITQNPPKIYCWLMEYLKGNKVISQSVLFIIEALKGSDVVIARSHPIADRENTISDYLSKIL